LDRSKKVFHLGYEIVNDEKVVLKKVDRLRNVNDAIISGNPLACMGVFVHEEIMKVNLFNEDRDLSGFEDWELWLRIGAKHKIAACNNVTAAIIQHELRSVLEVSTEKLVLKAERFIHYALNNEINQRFYGKKLRKTSASAMTYVALHLAMARASKRKVWRYVKAGFFEYPAEILKRRFLVIIRLMISTE
jgi:hypothetical protein